MTIRISMTPLPNALLTRGEAMHTLRDSYGAQVTTQGAGLLVEATDWSMVETLTNAFSGWLVSRYREPETLAQIAQERADRTAY